MDVFILFFLMKKIFVVKDMYNYVYIYVVIGGKISVGNFFIIIKLGNVL